MPSRQQVRSARLDRHPPAMAPPVMKPAGPPPPMAPAPQSYPGAQHHAFAPPPSAGEPQAIQPGAPPPPPPDSEQYDTGASMPANVSAPLPPAAPPPPPPDMPTQVRPCSMQDVRGRAGRMLFASHQTPACETVLYIASRILYTALTGACILISYQDEMNLEIIQNNIERYLVFHILLRILDMFGGVILASSGQ
jgi:hypothetical protein